MKKKVERVAKLISHYGFCSRKQAENFIVSGKVKINGQINKQFVFDLKKIKTIQIENKILFKPIFKVWVFNKPNGYICSNARQENKKIIFDLFPKSFQRVVSAGRLDLNSEGLLILSNNPEFTSYLENPKNKIQRKYNVKISGKITDEIIVKTKKKMIIKNIIYQPIILRKITNKENNNIVEITLFEGKNREIREILNHFGLMVKKLKRLEFGPFKLGNLEIGDLIEIKKEVLEKKCKILGIGIENFKWNIQGEKTFFSKGKKS